ncbi:MAG: TIGR01244 family sulfur transferase [Paracoccus sp. (in: a-proteobacteria)]|uniref:TIGR01244 family sulfur transferase n=1 Tax=Paracoccus sp. TaxID=267 RepID=UPI0026DF9FB7|nr:TIGR01244 family sulfur transferase [Paracoccus sp. (in: a-proteobacteria)]MDO5621388.1 TIGR01244 family sulfur transferase [Paracoccus sp. (in: a-proteobacteria)]
MDIRQLTPDLAVAPQIEIDAPARLAEAGFRRLIINRPDDEVGPDLDSAAMTEAARAAGLEVHFIPFSPQLGITSQMIAAMGEALALPGPTLAYCRSGNRSTVLWALSQAGKRPKAEMMEIAARAGYDLSGIGPMIDALAADPI